MNSQIACPRSGDEAGGEALEVMWPRRIRWLSACLPVFGMLAVVVTLWRRRYDMVGSCE